MAEGILDVSTPQKMESWKDSFHLMMKKLSILDKLGIEWIPYKKEYTGHWDTYDIEVLLPNDGCIIYARVKLPQFDDGQVRFLDQSINAVDGSDKNSFFLNITHLFNVLKGRVERGDAIMQDWEYAKKHEETSWIVRRRKRKWRW